MTKYYIAGHRGMVGSAIAQQLQAAGETNIVARTHAELDLTDQLAVRDFMKAERPDVVILAAAKVGGIHANNIYPADFIYENLMIECNVIHEAFGAGVKKLLHSGNRYRILNVRPRIIIPDGTKVFKSLYPRR